MVLHIYPISNICPFSYWVAFFFFLLICGNFYFNTVDINPFLVLYIANIFSQSTFPFDKTALLRYNWHTINCTYWICTIWWLLIYLYTCETITTIKILNKYIISQSSFVSLSCNTVPSSGTYYYGSLSAFSKILYGRNHTICTFFFAWLFHSV